MSNTLIMLMFKVRSIKNIVGMAYTHLIDRVTSSKKI
jgi:hypothetical protein